MSRLRDSLNEPLPAMTSSEPYLLHRVVKKLPAPDELPQPVQIEPLSDFQSRLTAIHNAMELQRIGAGDLLRIPEGLWTGPTPLDEVRGFVEDYLELVRVRGVRSPVNRLLQGFFMHYRVDRPSFDPVELFLARVVPQIDWDWQRRNGELNLFSRAETLPRLAEKVINDGADSTLGHFGFRGTLASCEFIEHAFRAGCKLVDVSDPKQLRELRAWSLGEDGFRFTHSRAEFATAILRPWLDKQPSEALRKQLLNILLSTLKDPRLHPTSWAGVDDALQRIVRRWLTKGSIEQFLDIVGEYAEDRMWHYRRAFWTAYMDKDFIDSAWVAYGDLPYDKARKTSLNDSRFGRNYARVTGANTRDKSVLIIEMGDVTIAEWSHNGQCWLWPPEHKTHAPKLFRSTYDAQDLRGKAGKAEGTYHQGAENGSWQYKVAELIKRYTGIKMMSRDLMPRS